MVRSRRRRSSCFKMMTCGGGDSINDDDVEPAEGEGSVDKRGWSFRKRSTRHRVLSNTVISEVPSSATKESPEATNIDFHAQNNPAVPKKLSMSQWMEEIPPLSTSVNSKVANPLITKETDAKIDPLVSTETASKIDLLVYTEAARKIDPLVSTETTTETVDFVIISENANEISQNLIESSAIAIQAAIRGYLAHRGLLKLKNIVKLQAAFRGHLERRQAVGTLRCVQAIVKMQALVRARRARFSLQESAPEKKNDSMHEEKSRRQVTLGKELLGSKANVNFSSTEKLLSNGFARQLLESAPKKKRIHIKCDPSKPDSAWKWLERWVSVSSSGSAQAKNPGNSPRHQEGENIVNSSEVETGTAAEVVSNSVDLEQNVIQAASAVEYEENLITYDADNFKFQACHPSSSTREVTLKPHCDIESRQAQNTSLMDDTSHMEMHLGATSQTLPVSISNKPEVSSEQPRRSMKRMASEQPETEGKKFGFGSRKACNPAFAAVQSKFEELTSSAISGRSNSSSQVVGVESKFNSNSSTAESGTSRPEHNLTENSYSHEPIIRVGGSDCGTELSISSTLDSPDRSEVGGAQFAHEMENVEKITSEPQKTTDNDSMLQNLDVEASKSSFTSELNSSCTIFQERKLDDVSGESVVTAVPVNTPPLELQPERSASDMQIQLEMQTDQQAYRVSREGSPKSHITIPESHGTPSSQVSVKAKSNKLDKSGSSQSRKSLSAGKRSPSNPKHDSGARSMEQLQRNSQNGKRRNSFGSPRPDQVDQDQRESSSNSLPSYMQATESARAKALANSSPRSSPDVQDKDIDVKKRHSLPGANGKQLSPRMQRSMSQVQQGGKGHGPHTQERKWQR